MTPKRVASGLESFRGIKCLTHASDRLLPLSLGDERLGQRAIFHLQAPCALIGHLLKRFIAPPQSRVVMHLLEAKGVGE
jgi:hypothetical protein